MKYEEYVCQVCGKPANYFRYALIPVVSGYWDQQTPVGCVAGPVEESWCTACYEKGVQDESIAGS